MHPLRTPGVLFALRFLLLAALFLGLLHLVPEARLHAPVRVWLTDFAAGALVHTHPELDVTSSRNYLFSSGMAVLKITAECDGLSTSAVLCAALLAYAPNLSGLAAALGGLCVVFLGNALRILLLFLFYAQGSAHADLFHAYAGPVFTLLPGLAWFLIVAPRTVRPPRTMEGP